MSAGMLLQAVAGTAWTLGWHCVLTALFCGLLAGWLDLRRGGRGGAHRRRVAAWCRGFRRQRRAVAPGLGVGLAVGGLHWLAVGGLPDWEPFRLVLPGLFFALAGPATAGCLLVLDAGRQEARGLARQARSQARAGGKTMWLGVVALLVGSAAALLLLPAATRGALVTRAVGPTFALLVGAVAIGLGGFVGLLAGLAGKPRPSGGVAALLYVGGLVTWFAAAAQVRALVLDTGC